MSGAFDGFADSRAISERNSSVPFSRGCSTPSASPTRGRDSSDRSATVDSGALLLIGVCGPDGEAGAFGGDGLRGGLVEEDFLAAAVLVAGIVRSGSEEESAIIGAAHGGEARQVPQTTLQQMVEIERRRPPPERDQLG